jgi:hypothetical protein
MPFFGDAVGEDAGGDDAGGFFGDGDILNLKMRQEFCVEIYGGHSRGRFGFEFFSAKKALMEL